MSFATPGWLPLLLLIPLLGIGAILASRLRKRQWTGFVAPRLRGGLFKGGSALPRWLALGFMLVACVALILGIARPRGEVGSRKEKTLGRNVMIALDISKSMRVADVKPDRLSQAKVVIYELLEAMPNERIGFIGFAGTPYVYAPLTIDHSAVRETVEQIDENWAPLGGSDLASAVQLATETLKKTGQNNNALVILSDGEKHDENLEEMIAAADQAGVYIVAIGVGTEDGGFVPNPLSSSGQMTDRSGRPVISRLQTGVMRKLAEDTQGRFAIAGSGMDMAALVKSVVSGLDAFEMDTRERKISIEFYQWLVLPAIFLLMGSVFAGTRWKGVQTAIVTGAAFLMTMSGTRASEATHAMDALKEERFEEARNAYHDLADETRREDTRARYRLGEGTAAYRGRDFRNARSAFSQALMSREAEVQASGHLGMGNSLFQLGWQGLTGESYPTDPESIPDINRFDTIVNEALAKMLMSEEEDGEGGFVKFENLITNWSDAVRHYDSSLSRNPGDKVARKNRETTMIYLKRLQELLKEHDDAMAQAMQQAQPGDGPPQEGDGEGDEEGEGDGSGQGKGNKNRGGDGDQEEDEGKGNKGDEEKDDKDGDKDGEGKNPNESPEERARRILKENADTEKGPLTPGRREFRDASKDW